MGRGDYPAIVNLVETFSAEGRDLYRVLLDVEKRVREALMEAIQGGGASEKLGAMLSSESLLRMLDALQQSEPALQKGLSEKVNFEVALLRAVEASQVRALDNLIRELKGLGEEPETAGKKKSLIPARRREVTPIHPSDPSDPSDPCDPSELSGSSDEPLLELEEAVARVPAGLRKEMEELLRAEFREVWRWQPPRKGE